MISYSQQMLNKNEIFSYWINNNNGRENPSNYRIRLDSLVVDFIDKLRDNGIDTIGAYEVDYVGAYAIDSCMCQTIPWIAYVQWFDDGKTYHQKITKCCKFKPIQINHSVLIRYYISAQDRIDNKRIFPIITGASKNEKGEILLNLLMIDHTNHYSIYCDLNGQTRFTAFEQYELEDNKNLFYNDNTNSIINSWRKMIDNQIKEIGNE